MADEFPGHYASSIREVAWFFGVKAKTVESWRAAGWFPKKTKLGYDLREIAQLRYQRLLDSPQRRNEDLHDSTKALEKEIKRIKRDKDQMALDEAAGKLVLIADVQQQLASWAVHFHEPLKEFASHLSNMVPGREKAAVVKQAEDLVQRCMQQIFDLTVGGKTVGEVMSQRKRNRRKRQ